MGEKTHQKKGFSTDFKKNINLFNKNPRFRAGHVPVM